MTQTKTRTERLAQWAAELQYQQIPSAAVQRTKDLFLDWLGCCIAGRSHPAVVAIARFASQMGPTTGKSEFVDGSLGFTTSPAFASLVNAAASHVVEQDDLHNRSIMHPVRPWTVYLSLRLTGDRNIGYGHLSSGTCRCAGDRRKRHRVHYGLRSGI